MNPNWRTFLETAGAEFVAPADEVASFGNAADELAAAAGQAVVVPLSHLALIEASGEDARTFLHSQLTSDINHLGPGQLQHSAWCTAKGRMQASFLTWLAGDNFRLALAADLQAAMLKRLQMFVLRSRVRISPIDDGTVLLGIGGTHARKALSAAGLAVPEPTLAIAEGNGVRVMALDPGRFIVELAAESAPAAWKALTVAARPCGTPVWRWLDVQAGFPLVTAATKEEFVPQMADFEKLGGVSFHKGCYPGQEIVARTQYLGKVKRHLYRVSSAAALAAGNDLHSPENPDQAAGKIISATPSPVGGWVGLAVVQSNFAANLHTDSREGPRVEAVAVNP
jgi:folate-binding protein YgfZ